MSVPEKVLIKEKSLKDIFREDFLKSVKVKEGALFPVNVMFVHEVEKEKGKKLFPLVLSHQNGREVKRRIFHLECPNPELLEEFANSLEGKNKGDLES